MRPGETFYRRALLLFSVSILSSIFIYSCLSLPYVEGWKCDRDDQCFGLKCINNICQKLRCDIYSEHPACKCEVGQKRECSDGPGKGLCSKGIQICGRDRKWGKCEYFTPRTEECNGKDDDCDGIADEGCECLPWESRTCYGKTGGGGKAGVGICSVGIQKCGDDGKWGPCEGYVEPRAEVCNGEDDDCDGKIDEDFDLASDSKNCGKCGNTCQLNQVCKRGKCQLAGGAKCSYKMFSLKPLPVPLSEFGYLPHIHKGKLYLFGGTLSPYSLNSKYSEKVSRSAFIYQLHSNSWSEFKEVLPNLRKRQKPSYGNNSSPVDTSDGGIRNSGVAALSPDGTIYIGPGVDFNPNLAISKKVLRYDPESPSNPAAEEGTIAGGSNLWGAVLFRTVFGELYKVGGFVNLSLGDTTVQYYNFGSKKFEPLNLSLPYGRFYTSILGNDGRLYMFRIVLSNNDRIGKVFAFNQIDDSIESLPIRIPLRVLENSPRAAVWNGLGKNYYKIYLYSNGTTVEVDTKSEFIEESVRIIPINLLALDKNVSNLSSISDPITGEVYILGGLEGKKLRSTLLKLVPTNGCSPDSCIKWCENSRCVFGRCVVELFADSFEGYSENKFPSSNWSASKGLQSGEVKVLSSGLKNYYKSASKVLYLRANSDPIKLLKKFKLSANSSDIIGYRAFISIDKRSRQIPLGFYDSRTGTLYGWVSFESSGEVRAGGDKTLWGKWSPNYWHRLTVFFNRTKGHYTVWIDGQKVGYRISVTRKDKKGDFSEINIDSIAVMGSAGGGVYIDELRVFEVK